MITETAEFQIKKKKKGSLRKDIIFENRSHEKSCYFSQREKMLALKCERKAVKNLENFPGVRRKRCANFHIYLTGRSSLMENKTYLKSFQPIIISCLLFTNLSDKQEIISLHCFVCKLFYRLQ